MTRPLASPGLNATTPTSAHFLAEWPDDDYIGLLDFLKKNGSRLGGETGMHFLRLIGKPAFITMPDVVKALIRRIGA